MNNVSKKEKIKSLIILTLILILTIVLIFFCFEENFKDELDKTLFYIYFTISLIYAIFSIIDVLMFTKAKLVLTIFNILSLIILIIVFGY